MKIDESVKNTVMLFSQSSYISFGVSNQFRNFDIRLEGFSVDRLLHSVLDSIWDDPTMVRWNLQVPNNSKMVRNKVRGRCRENIAS